MECISSGSRHTRFGKTELVAADPASFAALDEQPLLKEIRAGMCRHGYKVPASARVAATILPGIVFDVLRRAVAPRSR